MRIAGARTWVRNAATAGRGIAASGARRIVGSAGAAMLILLTTALGACVFVALATGVVIRWSLRPARARADAGALGLPVTEVSFDSASGARLAGWFAEGRPQGGAVALMHGVLSSRQAMAERMRFLNAAGFAVLAFDLQAHGESGGGSSPSAGSRASTPAPPFNGCARGCRASGSAPSASRSAARPLCSVPNRSLSTPSSSRRCSPTSSARRSIASSNAWAGSDWLAGPLILRIGALATGLDPAALRPIEAIGAVAAPILVMAGTADPRTTIAETRELFDRARPPKDYWEVAGAGHVDLCDFAGADYRRRILAFFERHLR